MLRALKIRHFRCYEAFETEFAPDLNVIVGPNAHGKTSLLEAACILLRLLSPRTSRLADLIQHERRGFVVDGYFNERHLQFYFSVGRKKLALDSVEQKTAREYLQIGRLVYFESADIEIARGGSDARRKFLDFIAVQRSAGYRKALRDYEKALRSRNALLKAPAPKWAQIDAFTEPLILAARELEGARGELCAELHPHVSRAHQAISATSETLEVNYVRGAGDNFGAGLAEARTEDSRLRQTTVGPHRDDLQFTVNGHPSKFASEGQQRTLVLALKLGAAELLKAHFGSPPLLLLDDVFGELDPSRRVALMSALPVGSQKLVTTTNIDWMPPEQPFNLLRLG